MIVFLFGSGYGDLRETALEPASVTSCKLPEFPLVHLQWFAAEDEGRTEEPTEYKIRKAREEGKVAKSPDLTASLVLLFPILAIGILGTYILDTMMDMLIFYLRLSTEVDITREGQILPAFLNYFLRLTLPVGAVAFVSAIAGNVFQIGFLFTVKPLKPDLKRIMPNIARYFKKALFSAEALFNLAKAVLKVVVIGVIAFLNIRNQMNIIVHFSSNPLLLSVMGLAKTAFRIMVECALAMIVLSIPDYLFQRKQHRDSLKMSKHELKEERKMHEGDPYIKSRLKERMRQILNQNMIKKVPEADVVITNPTHFAVALEYKMDAMMAPMVSAKGQDNLALRIREIALDHDIPVIENKPLARALYADVDLGDFIPEKYWDAVVVILTEVYKMNGKSARAV